MAEFVVLLVSGSNNRLEILKDSLQKVGWKVLGVNNPKDALGALQQTRFEAVFCDQDIKGASVPGLLSFTRRTHPNMPFYVFGDVDEKIRLSFKMSGDPTGFLHYPPVAAHLPLPKGTKSVEERAVGVKTPLSGDTSLVSLSTVIEMMGMAGQTAIIELDFGRKGLVYVEKGIVEHALVFNLGQTQQGLGALSQLLILENTEFRLVTYEAPKRPSINLPVASALSEASKMADEISRFQNFINAIRKACPHATAVAVGYPLNANPNLGFGDSVALFQKAKVLLEKNREASGSKPTMLLIATDQSSFAMTHFGDGNILVATAPANARDALFKAVRESLQVELVRG